MYYLCQLFRSHPPARPVTALQPASTRRSAAAWCGRGWACSARRRRHRCPTATSTRPSRSARQAGQQRFDYCCAGALAARVCVCGGAESAGEAQRDEPCHVGVRTSSLIRRFIEFPRWSLDGSCFAARCARVLSRSATTLSAGWWCCPATARSSVPVRCTQRLHANLLQSINTFNHARDGIVKRHGGWQGWTWAMRRRR